MRRATLTETTMETLRGGRIPEQLLVDLTRIAGSTERPICLTAYDYETGRSFTIVPEGHQFVAGQETVYIVREEFETTITKIKKIFRGAFYL